MRGSAASTSSMSGVQLTSKCNLLRPHGSAAHLRQRGRLVVTAAVKKSTVKNVVCHKTLVAKEDQAGSLLSRSHGLAHIHCRA